MKPRVTARFSIRWITAPAIVLLACANLYSEVRAAEAAGPAETVRAELQRYFFDAARSGDLPVLREFVAHGYDLETRTDKGYTALILAAYHGHAEALELLMRAGANPCAEDARGNTALMGAIFKGELVIVRRLMAASCSDPNHRNAAGQTPAMYAALFGRVEVLQALRERGADLSARDAAGNSAEALARGEFAAGRSQ
jgi:ankyrin repeat protein